MAAENQAIAKACKRVPKPSTLRGQTEFTLNAKQVDNSKVSDIAGILKTNSSLTFLGFRGWVGDQGAEAIASSLKHNSTLSTLSFDSTRVGHFGVMALSRALMIKCPLTELSLQYCLVEDKTVLFLAKALAMPSCGLHVLRLDFCPDISDASGTLIYETLLKNRCSKMEVMSLKGTAVNSDLQNLIRLLLLPGGRSLEKKESPACSAAAYITASFGVKKQELKKLQGLGQRIGPLSSTSTLRAQTLTPSSTLPKKPPNIYKKYAYNKNDKNNEIKVSSLDDDEEVDEEEAAINFVHSKYQLRPLMVDEQKRKRGASTANIKMLLKLNATLSEKMKKK